MLKAKTIQSLRLESAGGIFDVLGLWSLDFLDFLEAQKNEKIKKNSQPSHN